MNIDKLISSYPRTRPPLTPAHQAIYEQEYIKTRAETAGRPLISRIFGLAANWMHHRVASCDAGSILEIGAGTLNHLKYEPLATAYDVVEPFLGLFEQGHDKRRIRSRFDDIADIPSERKYDRVISIAAFEHLTNLPHALAKSGLLLEPSGRLQVSIPSEGGLGWGLAWRLTTGLAYRVRTGLDYKTLIRHEHINTAPEIVALCEHFYGGVKRSYFPMPCHQLSVFTYLECTQPDLNKCRTQLARPFDGGSESQQPRSAFRRAEF